MPPADAEGLEQLETRLRQDLDWLCLPAKSWVRPREADGARALDVLVVGAGMCGLAAAAALRLRGIEHLRVVDQARAGEEGPWATFARMQTLRSPKILTGPALGLPALTPRAWFEAQWGRAAWQALDKIPRLMWMDYLNWYRRVLALPVENRVRLTTIRPRADGMVDVELLHGDGSGSDGSGSASDQPSIRLERVTVRHLVLANGRDGFGGPNVPSWIAALPRAYWAHTSDAIDFDALAERRVAVIGMGASALDNAGCALEHGAARVDLFARRTDLPRINKLTGVSSAGLDHGFVGLPDEWKWRFLGYSISSGPPTPRSSMLRVSRHAHAFFHLGSPILTIEINPNGDSAPLTPPTPLTIVTPKGRYPVDFIIAGTGFTHNLPMRDELAELSPYVRLWRDRLQDRLQDRSAPPAGEDFAELSASPDLGAAFELQEKVPGSCPALRAVHCFNYASSMSHGKLSSDIPAVSIGAQRLAEGIASRLFVADASGYYEDLRDFATPELLGDEWHDADA